MTSLTLESHKNVEVLDPGSVVGDYTVGEMIGFGGFAVVYSAHHRRLDRNVALKIVRPEIVEQNPATAKRFLREINLVKSLEHPNIIRLYDFGETEEGLPFMTTELVRGETLSSLLRSEGKLPLNRAKSIVLQILSALVEAHGNNIIHRDMKPSNIMLTSKGAEKDWVQVLDFGIGKTLTDAVGEVGEEDLSEEDGGGAGTPRYMAPELFAGEEIGPFTDIYGLALMFCEMLTGETAVEGASIYEIVTYVFKNPLKVRGHYAGSDTAKIIERAAATRPGDRFQTALEFYTALDRDFDELGNVVTMVNASDLVEIKETEGGPVVVPRIPIPVNGVQSLEGEVEPDAPSRSRRTGVLVLVVLLLLLLVGALVVVVLSGPSEPDPALARATSKASRHVDRSIVLAIPEPEPEPEPEPPVVEVKKKVKISLQTRRKGVQVALKDGTILCEATPCEVELDESDEPVELVFTRKGFQPKPVMVTPRKNNAIKVGLSREPKTGSKKFDPFDVRHH